MIGDTVPVRLVVEGATVACGAVREGSIWKLSCASWPGIVIADRDFTRAKAKMTDYLRPEIARLRRQ